MTKRFCSITNDTLGSRGNEGLEALGLDRGKRLGYFRLGTEGAGRM